MFVAYAGEEKDKKEGGREGGREREGRKGAVKVEPLARAYVRHVHGCR